MTANIFTNKLYISPATTTPGPSSRGFTSTSHNYTGTCVAGMPFSLPA